MPVFQKTKLIVAQEFPQLPFTGILHVHKKCKERFTQEFLTQEFNDGQHIPYIHVTWTRGKKGLV